MKVLVNFKFLLKNSLLSILVFSQISFAARSLNLGSYYTLNPYVSRDFFTSGDDFIPIPWGQELPIPWLSLSGTWMLRKANTPSAYFNIILIKNYGSNSILQIQQIDPNTCEILGAGLANQASATIIYATLRDNKTGGVYRVNLRNYSLRSFNEMVSKKVPSYDGMVMMMSLAPINSYKFVHYSLSKLDTRVVRSNLCRNIGFR